jgi:anti-sigma factor RsiW
MKEFAGEMSMNCEEFATAGLDLGATSEDSPLLRAAREHMCECSHCALLHENWLALREELRVLGAETSGAEAPSRVEMRLREEFRAQHKTLPSRRRAVVLTWGLAAAATLVVGITWANRHFHVDKGPSTTSATNVVSPQIAPAAGTNAGEVLVASNSSGDFTFLPDSVPMNSEDATVVHVQMQRAALGALGLTVNEEHAGDWIQVDLLVGDDGLPQAVRLPESGTQTTN